MNAQKRLDALAVEIAEIEAEIADLIAQHDERVRTDRSGVTAYIFDQIVQARARLEAAQMRRAPLEAALQAEQSEAQAKLAEELTADADAQLDALEVTLAQALDAARALAAITDELDPNAALSWSIVARRAIDAGGKPARRHLASLRELNDSTDRAVRRLRHVAQDYSERAAGLRC